MSSAFGPAGSFAAGAAGPGGGAAPDVVLTEGVGFGAAITSAAAKVLRGGVSMSSTMGTTLIKVVSGNVSLGEAVTAVPVKFLSSNVRLAGNPRGIGEFGVHANETVNFGGALVVVWQALIDENISLAGEVAGQPTKIARIVEALVASGTVATHTEARVALVAALAINGMTATGWHVSAAETVGFQEAFRAQLIATTALLDGINAGDIAAPSLRLTAVLDETLAFDDDAKTTLAYLEKLGEDVLFFGSIRLGDDEYVGWVLNGGAASEYKNYPFNGFAQFNGRYYGTASDGLYLLEGDDDDGDPIQASIKTALMDFGTGVLKRIPDVYVAFVGSDKLLLKVVTPGQRGEQVETIYTSDVPAGTALHNGRIRIGQGLKSRYWQFELSNVDGAEFEIDELAWRPMTLDRRT